MTPATPISAPIPGLHSRARSRSSTLSSLSSEPLSDPPAQDPGPAESASSAARHATSRQRTKRPKKRAGVSKDALASSRRDTRHRTILGPGADLGLRIRKPPKRYVKEEKVQQSRKPGEKSRKLPKANPNLPRERIRRPPKRYIEEEDVEHQHQRKKGKPTKRTKVRESPVKSLGRSNGGPKKGKEPIKIETVPRTEPTSTDDVDVGAEDEEGKIKWTSHQASEVVISSLDLGHLFDPSPRAGPSRVQQKVVKPPKVIQRPKKGQKSAIGTAVMTSKFSTKVQPLPPRSNCPGYPSSRFCKLLRIIAGLSPPRPSKRTTASLPASGRRPPVWAESRQELCEALPYYRAFQSGLYMSGRVAYGYLLEAFPAPRDIWADGGRVVISHGGGQCVKVDNASGKSACVLAADQSPDDARVDTLLQAYNHQTPLILIAGEGYEQLPWKLGCAYAVLGWYWISAMWVEAEPAARGVKPPQDRNYFHRYKVRFDWVESQGTPWWLEDTRSTDVAGSSPHAVSSDSALVSALDDESSPPRNDSTIQAWESLRDRIKIDSLCEGVRRDPVTGLLTPPITPPKGDIILERPKDAHDVSTNLTGAKASQDHPSALDQLQDYVSDSELEVLRDSSEKGCPSTAFDKQRKATGDTVLLRRNATLLMDFEPSYTSRSHLEMLSHMPCDEAWLFDSSLSERSLPGSRPLRDTNRVAASEATPSIVHRSTVCPSCAQSSPRVYREGWICLLPRCSQFWLVDTPLGLMPIPPGFSLTYDPCFLRCAPSPSSLVKMPYNIVPDLAAAQTDDAGSGALMRGWVCGSCGRVNCRYRWEVWECANCKRLHSPILSNACTPISSLETFYPSFMGDASAHPESGIAVDIQYLEGRTIMTYTLPRSLGKVYHVSHRDRSVADELWQAYQVEAVKGPDALFERRPLKAATIKGALLAQHFAVNSGAEYKYNVATSSLPFDRSPSCVLRALDHIKSTADRVLDEDVPFNEILSVMYREGQKMSWHDDGEVGLGPVVASLSLGSSATMSWRPKAERVQPNKPYYLGHEHKSTRANPITILELTLSHGDIIIMQGREMQERYSHRVIPHGFRVAATAREIRES